MTDEQKLDELRERLAAVQRRQATPEMRKTPVIDRAVAAVLSLEKAASAAYKAQDLPLLVKLQEAREPLAAYLLEQGVVLPKPRRPKGSQPKS